MSSQRDKLAAHHLFTVSAEEQWVAISRQTAVIHKCGEKRQHLVRAVDYSLPDGDSHPARDTKLRLAHTIPAWKNRQNPYDAKSAIFTISNKFVTIMLLNQRFTIVFHCPVFYTQLFKYFSSSFHLIWTANQHTPQRHARSAPIPQLDCRRH